MKKWFDGFILTVNEKMSAVYEDLKKRFPVIFDRIGKRLAFIIAGSVAFLVVLAVVLLCVNLNGENPVKAKIVAGQKYAHQVTMSGYKFLPETMTIKVGETVTWLNTNLALHDVVFKEFRSGPVKKGAIYTHTFKVAGTYEYYCSYHMLLRKQKHLIIVKP